MIRQIEPRDMARLQELRQCEWPIDESLIDALVLTDENDTPVMFVGAWKLAEIHCAIDHEWRSPKDRLEALWQIHEVMRLRLARGGYGQVVTWFDEQRMGFLRRLERWGWIRSKKTSWHRGTE